MTDELTRSDAVAAGRTGRGGRSPGRLPPNWKESGLRITILTVPDCPNVPVVRDRLTAALDGRAAGIELVEVSEEADAARWGMTGSPTVLLDGIDPFAVPGAPPSVSCRLYRDAEGRADGAPSVQALREALTGAHRLRQADEQDCCQMALWT
ncbi:hypothetical protein [Streptomyces sp. DSM 40907]|uniref:hypothetical protein n=1 Tax=Streptomyces kutzneri TaxID=3051179 RepID=UPI0028D5F0F5|nr:hypothetical protein [Streptomyces sp. DSM 40907]